MATKTKDKNVEISNQKSRKKWSIQDEPHSLLKRLRSQLAEDGCAESQLMMGEALLQHAEGNLLENQQQAVYWFIQSSLQGNPEATERLEKCLNSGIGISEKNFQDVKTCLTMDLQVKLAAVAARKVFERLSEGNGFISEKSLSKEVCCYQNDRCASTESIKDKFGSERITESVLLNASKDYTDGKLPSLIHHQVLCTSKCRINLVTTYLFLLQALLSFFNKLFCIRKLSYVILITVFISPLMTFTINEMSFCLAHLIWLCCFVCMIYSLTTILMLNEHFKLFGMWGRLFHRHCLQIDCSAADSNFNSRYFPLLVGYFFSVAGLAAFSAAIYNRIIILVLFPLIFACSLLTVSLLMTSKFHAFSLLIFTLSISYRNLSYVTSIYVNVFDWIYITEVDSLQFLFNSNIPLQSVWLLSLVCLYVKRSIFDVLLQAALLLSFKLISIFVSIVNFDDISIGCSVVWVIFILPSSRRHFLRVLPGILICLSLLSSNYNNTVCYSTSVTVVLAIYILMLLSPKCGYLINTLSIIFPLLFFIYNQFGIIRFSNLDWEYYQNACLPRTQTSVNLMHECSSLTGVVIQWEGVVKTVEVSSVTNRVEAFLLFLPLAIQRPMRCLIGCRKLPMLLDSIMEECSTHELNSYTYDITLIMERPFWKLGSSEICLRAETKFKRVAGLLASGDAISFVGMLEKGLGTDLPIIKLFGISCLKCKSENEVNISDNGYVDIIIKSTKEFWETLLYSMNCFIDFSLNTWNTLNLHL